MDRDPLEGMETVPCSFCGGGGTMRENKSLRMIHIEDGIESEPEVVHVVIGEPCPTCVGRGRVGTFGRKLNS